MGSLDSNRKQQSFAFVVFPRVVMEEFAQSMIVMTGRSGGIQVYPTKKYAGKQQEGVVAAMEGKRAPR